MDRHKLILGEMTHNLCYKIVSEHTYTHTHTHTSTTVHRWPGYIDARNWLLTLFACL